MRCWIYKSSRKDELYLYVREKDGFDGLPPELVALIGRPELVMDLDLDPRRTLARVDVGSVMEALESQGFFLQMPPAPRPGPLHGR